uniref:G-protein coupled receptors family 1 profile domain-containing protein n=1 Tax=Petromyzon marinus TaxID=7757 RepID=S4RWC2_PETMA
RAMEGNDSYVILGTLEAPHNVRLLAFTLCLIVFVASLLANLLVLLSVVVRPQLHKPVYAFMCNLMTADIIGCTGSLPQQLYIFLTGDTRIPRSSCIAQMFSMNLFVGLECFALALMAIAAIWGFVGAVLVPLTILVNALKLRDGDRQIQGVICDYMGFVRLSQGDTQLQAVYSTAMVVVLFVVPLLLIAYTYARVIVECARTRRSDFKAKAVNTFLTHFFMLAVFFVATFLSVLVSRLVKDLQSAQARNMRYAAGFSTFFIPMANVSIYVFRTKELRREVTHCLRAIIPSDFCGA